MLIFSILGYLAALYATVFIIDICILIYNQIDKSFSEEQNHDT